ncbi:hypothetical protein ACOME3_005647 [Neoechinorhynchus agilis]
MRRFPYRRFRHYTHKRDTSDQNEQIDRWFFTSYRLNSPINPASENIIVSDITNSVEFCKGWYLYFPTKGLYHVHVFTINTFRIRAKSRRRRLLQRIQGVFRKPRCTFSSETVRQRLNDFDSKSENIFNLLALSYYQVPVFFTLPNIYIDFLQIIYERETIELSQLCVEFGNIDVERNIPSKVVCRPMNTDRWLVEIASIRSNLYGEFITIRGRVARVGTIQPVCLSLAYECSRCGSILGYLLKSVKSKGPTKCIKCNSTSLHALLGDSRGKMFRQCVDSQQIRIQEAEMDVESRFGDDDPDVYKPTIDSFGRAPRFIDVRCVGSDLMDLCAPGNCVQISGVVKADNEDDRSLYQQNQQCSFKLYINAYSILVLSTDGAHGTVNSLAEDFSIDDLYAIRELSEKPHLFK